MFADMPKRLMRIIANHHVVAAVVVCVVILGFSALVVIVPKVNELREVGLAGRETRQATLENLNAELRALTTAQARFNQISQEQFALLEAALPKEKDIPQLIVDIPAFINLQGFGVGQIDTSETTFVPRVADASSTIRRVDVTVTVAGIETYEKLKSFLVAVEDSLRLMDVTSVSYRPGTTSYGFVLTTYYTTARASGQ